MAAPEKDSEKIGVSMLAELDRWTEGPRVRLDIRRIDPIDTRARLARALEPGGSLTMVIEALLDAESDPEWVSQGVCMAILSDMVVADSEQLPAVSEAKHRKHRKMLRAALAAMDDDGDVGVLRERLQDLVAQSERYSRIRAKRPIHGDPGAPRRASTAIARVLEGALRQAGVTPSMPLVLPVLRDLFPAEEIDAESIRGRLKALRERQSKG